MEESNLDLDARGQQRWQTRRMPGLGEIEIGMSGFVCLLSGPLLMPHPVPRMLTASARSSSCRLAYLQYVA